MVFPFGGSIGNVFERSTGDSTVQFVLLSIGSVDSISPGGRFLELPAVMVYFFSLLGSGIER